MPGNPQLQQLSKATAGRGDVTHPAFDGANSNIVRVVANGHVYVASYKELDIFGFGPPVLAPSAAVAVIPPSEPAPAGSVKSSFGFITKVEGSRFTMKTDAGTEVQVDAEKAIKDGLTAPVAVRQPLTGYGST